MRQTFDHMPFLYTTTTEWFATSATVEAGVSQLEWVTLPMVRHFELVVLISLRVLLYLRSVVERRGRSLTTPVNSRKN